MKTAPMRWWTIRLSKRVIISLVLLITVLVVMQSNLFWRLMYPINYMPSISREADRVGLDPMLVAAITNVESKYEKDHVSHAGAIGLMQLMPSTASWIASKSGIVYDPAKLQDRDTNLRLGSWYIAYLIRHFRGNVTAAVAAYNAGPNKVDGWLSRGVWSGELSTADNIPIGETRHFVQRVFYNYDIYRRVYGKAVGAEDRVGVATGPSAVHHRATGMEYTPSDMAGPL